MPGLRAGIKTRNRGKGETSNLDEGKICSIQDVVYFETDVARMKLGL